MKKFCIECGKEITANITSKFCSRSCWEAYKSRKNLTVSPERQATIFLKTPFTEESYSEPPKKASQKAWKPLNTDKAESASGTETGQKSDMKSSKYETSASEREQTLLREIAVLKEEISKKNELIMCLKKNNKELEEQLKQQSFVVDTLDESASFQKTKLVPETAKPPAKQSVWRKLLNKMKR